MISTQKGKKFRKDKKSFLLNYIKKLHTHTHTSERVTWEIVTPGKPNVNRVEAEVDIDFLRGDNFPC